MAMPQRLTLTQRKTYEGLRLRIQVLMTEYDGYRQDTLADSVGASQSLVSQVLRGRVTSIPILERLARVLMMHISQTDRRALRDQLEISMRVFRGRGGKAR
jgi:predicted transcriptional regulator